MRYPQTSSPARRSSSLLFGACAVTASLITGVPLAHSTPAAPMPRHAQGCLNGFDCDMSSRIAAVDRYLASRPGFTGYVLRDRQTGGVYRNANADTMFWTASTIKLAIAEDLLNRARIGAIIFTPDDRAQLESMLATSNDDAANALWDKYAGPDRMAFDNAFHVNGMSGLTPQPTAGTAFPDWSFQQCAPADLDRLMDNVLDHMHPDDRGYLLDRMRNVDANQHWGVWAAGDAMRPGLKNGWSEEADGWVVNSVGFAGPDERYTLAIMNGLGDQGGYTDGEQTVSHVAQALLAGR